MMPACFPGRRSGPALRPSSPSIKDSPADRLMRYDIEAKHPADFGMESLDLAPALVAGCLTPQLENPPGGDAPPARRALPPARRSRTEERRVGKEGRSP